MEPTMKCPICNFGEMKDGKAIVTLQREEAVIVIKNVPARVCENCGEYMLSEAVTARVMELAEQAIAHHAEIEVLQYAA
jgi:YgiT-type zinc finger domain-containing protein